MALGMEVGLSSGDFVRWRPITPPQNGADPPIFGPCLLRPNGCMDQDVTWYGGRHRPRRHCVRCGPSSPLQKGVGAPSPIFGPCLLCPNGLMDQGGTWHGGGPWSRPHCARWGPSSPPQQWCTAPPIFGPSFLWPNGWMHQDATWYGGRPHPRPLCVIWGSSPLPKGADSPQFSVHVYFGQMTAWIKMPFGTEVGLGLSDIVLDGDPAQPPLKGHIPQIFGQCPLWPIGWMD